MVDSKMAGRGGKGKPSAASVTFDMAVKYGGTLMPGRYGGSPKKVARVATNDLVGYAALGDVGLSVKAAIASCVLKKT